MTSKNPPPDKSSCPPPASHRRPMSEPRPGVASWFNHIALRALTRLIFLDAKDGFIRDHQSREADGNGEQQTDAARAQAGDVEQTRDDHQSKNLPPMFVHAIPARPHGRAEIHLFINDERLREQP